MGRQARSRKEVELRMTYSPPGTGGVDAPSNVRKVADGVVILDGPPRLRFQRWLRNIFLMRSHPSCSRGIRSGEFAVVMNGKEKESVR